MIGSVRTRWPPNGVIILIQRCYMTHLDSITRWTAGMNTVGWCSYKAGLEWELLAAKIWFFSFSDLKQSVVVYLCIQDHHVRAGHLGYKMVVISYIFDGWLMSYGLPKMMIKNRHSSQAKKPVYGISPSGALRAPPGRDLVKFGVGSGCIACCLTLICQQRLFYKE